MLAVLIAGTATVSRRLNTMRPRLGPETPEDGTERNGRSEFDQAVVLVAGVVLPSVPSGVVDGLGHPRITS